MSSRSVPDLTKMQGNATPGSDMTRSATEATSLLAKDRKERTLQQMGVLRSVGSCQSIMATTAGRPLGGGIGSFANLAMLAMNEESSEDEGEKRNKGEKTSDETAFGTESEPFHYTSSMKRRKAQKQWGKLKGSFGLLLDAQSSQTVNSIGKGVKKNLSFGKLDMTASSSEEEDPMEVKTLSELRKEFGMQPLIMIVIGGWFLDGLCTSMASAAVPYIYAEYNLSSASAQVYQTIATLPGGLTVAVGMFTIFFNFNGYRNLPYMTLTTVLAVIGYGVLYFTPFEKMNPKLITVLVFLGSLQATTAGCLIRGDLAAKAKSHPVYTQALVAFISSGSALMSSIGGVLYGPISENSNTGGLGAIGFCGLCSLLLLPPAICNFLGEQPGHTQVMVEKLKKQWELPLVAFLICGSAVAQSAIALCLTSTIARYITSLVNQAIMFALIQIFLRPEIRRACCFMITCCLLCPSTSMATFHFYVDDALQFPGGPNYTPNFYMSVLGIVGIVSMICGQIILYPYLNKLPYNTMFFVEGCTKVAIALPQLIQLTRFNLRLGISDEVFSIIYQFYSCFPSMLLGIPMTSYFARVCPTDLEITVFALMISVYCISYTNESYFGAVLMEALGVEPNGAHNEQAQFDNIWLLALISGVAPMIHYKTMGGFFLPRKYSHEAVLKGNEGSAVAGSRFRMLIKSMVKDDEAAARAAQAEANP